MLRPNLKRDAFVVAALTALPLISASYCLTLTLADIYTPAQYALLFLTLYVIAIGLYLRYMLTSWTTPSRRRVLFYTAVVLRGAYTYNVTPVLAVVVVVGSAMMFVREPTPQYPYFLVGMFFTMLGLSCIMPYYHTNTKSK